MTSFRGYVKHLNMHELRIAEDLSEIVLNEAKKAGLSIVTKVNISFGKMVQIVPDIFEFAFRECVRDTFAQDAKVIIEIVPVKMKCMRCGEDFRVTENKFECSACGSADLEIIQGKELFINSIEGE